VDNGSRIVTQADLREHGLSSYLIGKVVKGLDFSSRKSGLRLYTNSDIIAAIEGKLAQPKTRSVTREKLRSALVWLRGESNVIKVDFLKNLSLEERVETLKSRIEVADRNLEANVLKEYEAVQKRIRAALAGSRL
jgi:hypothetical protein